MISTPITHKPIAGQPIADLSSYDGQIALAIQLRLDDMRSQKRGERLPGADTLLDQIERRALQANVANLKLISPTHLRRKLKEHFNAGTDPEAYEVRYVDLDEAEPFLRSYLVRLAAVKTLFNMKGQLTEAEAKAALRVYYEFNDPYGETVDLIPQFAIVHELAEREANTLPVDDIDGYFAFAPWKSDENRYMYLFALTQFRAAPPQLRLICPFIPVGKVNVKPVALGAHAQLGMPYALAYQTPVGSGENPIQTAYTTIPWGSPDLTTKLSPEESKDLCNWQLQLQLMEGEVFPDFGATPFFRQEQTQEPILRSEEREVSND